MIEQLQNGRVLTSESGGQGVITVLENKLFRWLCFDDELAIQSCMPLESPEKLILPYQQYMMMWQLLAKDTALVSASILGIGGGDIIRFLRSNFPSMKITAVDNEPRIAQFASEYFLIKPDQVHLTLQIEDARIFIKKPHRHDLLLIDIVANNILPDFLAEHSFWQDCHASLNENGIMAVNFIPQSKTHFVMVLDMLRSIFGHLPLCLEVPEHKNVVLLIPLKERPELMKQKTQEQIATEMTKWKTI